MSRNYENYENSPKCVQKQVSMLKLCCHYLMEIIQRSEKWSGKNHAMGICKQAT